MNVMDFSDEFSSVGQNTLAVPSPPIVDKMYVISLCKYRRAVIWSILKFRIAQQQKTIGFTHLRWKKIETIVWNVLRLIILIKRGKKLTVQHKTLKHMCFFNVRNASIT